MVLAGLPWQRDMQCRSRSSAQTDCRRSGLSPCCSVDELEAVLAAADAERAAQRQQLARLKQQMLSEQDDEEDKIR